jgi:anionic cell wall polymer biosynthesis LytR-Cps2A-Psr (LCP) family protein
VKKLLNATFILFLLIIVTIAATSMFLYQQLRTDSVQQIAAQGEIVRVLMVFHDDDEPYLSTLMFIHPETNRLALLDIPSNVGMVLRPLGRVDGIGAVFDDSQSDVYRRQVEQLTGVTIPFLISHNRQEMERFIDLLGGIEIFMISDYRDTADVEPLLMASGLATLDGYHALEYMVGTPVLATDLEQVGRRQSFLQAFLREIQHNGELLVHPDVIPFRERFMKTDLEMRAVNSLFGLLQEVDLDRAVRRRIQGTVRPVDVTGTTRQLLFPHFGGQWLQQSVEQIEQTIASTSGDMSDAVTISVEILNGTGRTGLARRTAERYENFGFEILEVGNAESSTVEQTVILDRRGFGNLAEQAAEIISARRIVVDVDMESVADVTIILGGDFDGNRVRTADE